MVTLEVETPVVRIGTVGSVIVSCYRSTPTVEALDQTEQVELRLLERFKQVTSMTIAGPGASLLRIDEKVRMRSLDMTKKFEGRVRGAAIVIATKGLSAVMARSFMSTYLLLSKSSWPMQTFSSIEAAVIWAQQLPGHEGAMTVAEIEAFERGG